MKQIYSFLIILYSFVTVSTAQVKEVNLKFVETTDIHGNFFPYNFLEGKAWEGSLARVYSFVQAERAKYKDNLILIDNGDVLQGQPTVYYYNFIDTASIHIAADMMNYMKYDIGNMGNHDVETGHAVFDRWIRECNFPVLGANIIRTSDNETYLKPYEVLNRDGVKIVVLGMITPAIPTWLPENLWAGLRFEDMEETARKWMKIIREKENPDLVIGTFHSGKDAIRVAEKYNENASVTIAKRVPGFDIVMIGHDHLRACTKVVNVNGDSVLIIDPASNGVVVGDVDVKVILKDGKVISKSINGVLTDVKEYGISDEFMDRFSMHYAAVNKFVSRKIGTFTHSLNTKPAYFGPSAFVDLIHTIQLDLTKADISFAAPLTFNAKIKAGDVMVSDMFNLYKYENMLYTMALTGKEIKNFLEESYGMWANQMESADDHLVLLKKNEGNSKNGYSFRNFSFNFDSAAGIIYTVDVTKPKWHKITISSMADGSPFDEKATYKVALNSYRGNGGGELLTKGAGIPQDELKMRIVTSTDKDFRYYLMDYINRKQTLDPQPLNHWRFIPEEWTVPAAGRDAELLFGKEL